MPYRFKKNNQGFTLIELLIVVAVIAILATVVFVALNPVARFEDARNSRRWNDMNAIVSAIKLYQVDKRGHLAAIQTMMNDMKTPDGLAFDDSKVYQVGTGGGSCEYQCLKGDGDTDNKTLQANCVDLTTLVTAGYLPKVPSDPNASGVSDATTRYYISATESGAIIIGACDPEKGSDDAKKAIEVKR